MRPHPHLPEGDFVFPKRNILPEGGQVLDLELVSNNGINRLKAYSRYKIQDLTPEFLAG